MPELCPPKVAWLAFLCGRRNETSAAVNTLMVACSRRNKSGYPTAPPRWSPLANSRGVSLHYQNLEFWTAQAYTVTVAFRRSCASASCETTLSHCQPGAPPSTQAAVGRGGLRGHRRLGWETLLAPPPSVMVPLTCRWMAVGPECFYNKSINQHIAH